MTALVVIWDGMQAVRERGVLKWVPLEEAGAADDVERAAPRVVPCECGTMKPAGARYHAAVLRERDEMVCHHGNVYWSACSGRVPPPCCWEDDQ